jgi:hypothetical protein
MGCRPLAAKLRLLLLLLFSFVKARANRSFLRLRAFLDDITERVIRESVFADDSEAEEVAEPRALTS